MGSKLNFVPGTENSHENYDPILNCCSNFYYVLIVYLKPDYFFLFQSQYPEGPVTGHLVSGFSWFPWVLEQMLGWFPTVPSCHYMLLMWPSIPKL